MPARSMRSRRRTLPADRLQSSLSPAIAAAVAAKKYRARIEAAGGYGERQIDARRMSNNTQTWRYRRYEVRAGLTRWVEIDIVCVGLGDRNRWGEEPWR